MADTPENNENQAQAPQEDKKEAPQEGQAAEKQATETPDKKADENGIELDEFETPQSKSQSAPSAEQAADAGLEAVYDIPVRVSAVLGETQMEINKLLKLGRGAVVVLDRKIGEAIDIYVNERLVARGEVVIADEDKLGVTMTEIVKLPK